MLMDAAASAEQAAALGAVFSGEKGGPPATLGPLIGEMIGVQAMPIEYADDGRRHTVKIGDNAEIEIEDFIPEGATGAISAHRIANPVASTFTIAPPTKARGSLFGLSFELGDRHGVSASFPGRRESPMSGLGLALEKGNLSFDALRNSRRWPESASAAQTELENKQSRLTPNRSIV
jgi:hypothetical protein